MAKILIIGGVAGGMSAAARLRRNREQDEIIVCEKGPYVSFANCGLPYYLGGVIPRRESLLLQTPASLKKRFAIDVRTGNEAISLDAKRKTVRIRDGNTGREYEEGYDKLLLSPGAEPIRPPIPGIDHPRIFTVRNIPDTDRIKNFLAGENPRGAVIVGGGYIGIEMAENLHTAGLAVTVVEAMPQIMGFLDFELARLMEKSMGAEGVEVLTGAAVASFAVRGNAVGITLAGGREITGDMVIFSVGVKPEAKLAAQAGLAIGAGGGIVVNEYLQTSDPDIYAVGDAVEVLQPVSGKRLLIPLAGPANKQGRLAADNMAFGNKKAYRGTLGASVLKVFGMTAAAVGANERALKAAGITFQSVTVHPENHAGYYPGSAMLSLKVLFSVPDGKILGAQAVGKQGTEKRIDVISALMLKEGTVSDMAEFEQAYAPPYSSAKDPVNMAGFAAENILSGKVRVITWDSLRDAPAGEYEILDVRTPAEFAQGAIAGAKNIPVDELRERLGEIPREKKIVAYCKVGLRSYLANRILLQNGLDACNLSGGYYTWINAVS